MLQPEENIEYPTGLAVTFDADNPPWNNLMAVGYWLFSIAAIVVAQGIATVAYSSYSGISFAEAIKDPATLLVSVVAVLPAHLITLAVGWMIVTRMGNYSFSEMVGMDWGGFRWWHAVLIVIAMFALFALFLSIFGEQENDFKKLLESSRGAVYAVAFVATFSAPVVEEVVYRGVLYSAVKRSLNTLAAVVLITILFAGVHLVQYWGDLATIFSLFSLSLGLTLVRAWTGNILPCIVLHFLFNGIQTTMLVLEPWIKPLI